MASQLGWAQCEAALSIPDNKYQYYCIVCTEQIFHVCITVLYAQKRFFMYALLYCMHRTDFHCMHSGRNNSTTAKDEGQGKGQLQPEKDLPFIGSSNSPNIHQIPFWRLSEFTISAMIICHLFPNPTLHDSQPQNLISKY